MNKSHVTIEQQQCIVCGEVFDTGSLLLDKRLRERFDHTTLTGWGMCPVHMKLYDDGYIALIECDEKYSAIVNNRVQPEEAYRTGTVAHIRKEIFTQIFDTSVPEQGIAFVEKAVIEKIQELQNQSNAN